MKRYSRSKACVLLWTPHYEIRELIALKIYKGNLEIAQTNHGSRICAGQSRDCANPRFTRNIYILTVHARILFNIHVFLGLLTGGGTAVDKWGETLR